MKVFYFMPLRRARFVCLFVGCVLAPRHHTCHGGFTSNIRTTVTCARESLLPSLLRVQRFWPSFRSATRAALIPAVPSISLTSRASLRSSPRAVQAVRPFRCESWRVLALLLPPRYVQASRESLLGESVQSRSLDSPRVINLPSARRRVRIGFHRAS